MPNGHKPRQPCAHLISEGNNAMDTTTAATERIMPNKKVSQPISANGNTEGSFIFLMNTQPEQAER
jgi:hypothetical protein